MTVEGSEQLFEWAWTYSVKAWTKDLWCH